MSATINNNPARIGHFTSSEIHKLLTLDKKGGFGKPALTYIKTRGMERRLNRSIQSECNARELSWGTVCETYSFGLLDMSYKICSQDTIVHPKYPFWAGSADGERFIAEKTVVEQKCPFTLLSFCTAIDAWEVGGIAKLRDAHEAGEKWYWQCVSNAILTDSTHAELVIFCPYQRELSDIRLLAMDAPPEQAGAVYWLNYATDNELPYLIEGGHYKNLNVLRFPVPDEDKRILEMAVLEAEKELTSENPVRMA